MNVKNEVEKRSSALPSNQLRRPEGRGTPEQIPPYPIGENVPRRAASTLNELPQHPAMVHRPTDLIGENVSKRTTSKLNELPQYPAMVHRPTDPADLQSDWRKPPASWSAETSPSKRPADAGRTWIAKHMPLLVGVSSLGAVLLLLHMIHTLF